MSLEFRTDFVELLPEGVSIRGNGTATAYAKAVRAGVQEYREDGETVRELRKVNSVKAVTPYFDRIPIVLDHPKTGLVYPDNTERLAIGCTGKGYYEDGWIIVPIAITAKRGIEAIKSTHRQFSAGYFVSRIEEGGTWIDEDGVMGEQGQAYEYDRIAEYKIPNEAFGEQAMARDIFNHLALVEAARAGDEATFVPTKEITNDAVDIRLDAAPISFQQIKEDEIMENTKSMESKPASYSDNEMVGIDMGNSKYSMSKDMMPIVKDMMKGIHDMAQKMGVSDTYSVSADGDTYMLPKKVSDMVMGALEKIKNSDMMASNTSSLEKERDMAKQEMEQVKQQADAAEARATNAQEQLRMANIRKDELEKKIQTDSTNQDAIVKEAQQMAQSYEAGKDYFAQDKQPSFKEASEDMTAFKRKAIHERYLAMDEDLAKQSGWGEDAIKNWDAKTVDNQFENMIRFLPPVNKDTRSESHTAIFDRANRPHQAQPYPVTVPRRTQDVPIGQLIN